MAGVKLVKADLYFADFISHEISNLITWAGGIFSHGKTELQHRFTTNYISYKLLVENLKCVSRSHMVSWTLARVYLENDLGRRMVHCIMSVILILHTAINKTCPLIPPEFSYNQALRKLSQLWNAISLNKLPTQNGKCGVRLAMLSLPDAKLEWGSFL